MEARGKTGFEFIEDKMDRLFWGYQLKPLSVVGWLALLIFAFALVYLGQTRSLGEGRGPIARSWTRFRFALMFSLRTTLQPKFGYERSTTSLFKAITSLQWVLSVILLTCLLYTVSKTSPLINELIKKLVA
ncbi:hypothetical protein K788_00009580 (plasmid) [Paraburkholderia caribensis MBA4]|uniref:Uncharacterized protein n=1 Tax=Paraburkholderia caribensis MBA4 TaxID=1323664 RepID=A0A0P0RQP7_9BURK|nr:hypothetical protein K788_00009580 [Paraburkholderia caribensis MBA4]